MPARPDNAVTMEIKLITLLQNLAVLFALSDITVTFLTNLKGILRLAWD